jgi:stage II sporulation protein D
MSWYDKNQANGYDICPTASCQLYLGYDGEEPAMSRAVAVTAGRIRTFGGRPILAMYHGNGGGRTESYRRAVDNGTDPHPYLVSVAYPFARPSRWQQRTTMGEIAAALGADDAGVGGPIERIEVVERGESPRVMRVRITTDAGSQELSGSRFAGALELPSTWFDIGDAGDRSESTATGFASIEGMAGPGVAQAVDRAERWWVAAALSAAASAALSLALRLRRRSAAAEVGNAEELERPCGEVGEHL